MEDLGVDGNVIKILLEEMGAMVWTGFVWVRRRGGEAVMNMEMNFVFHKILGVS